MIDAIELQTARLVLEPLGIARAQAILAGDYTGMSAAPGWPHDDTISAVTMAANAARDSDTGWLILCNGQTIGDIGTFGGVSDLDGSAPREVEIGYGLAMPERGRGFASEAVDALANWLLDQPGTGAVIASTAPGNEPSISVLRRCGFRAAPSPDPDRMRWIRTR